MHPLFSKADSLTGTIIGAAIEVHRVLGPGLLESIDEKCLLHELSLRSLSVLRQQSVTVWYKDLQFEDALRLDLLVEGCVLVELKAVEQVAPIHKAQVISYLKLLDVPVGLLINFHELKLIDGVHRLMLPGVNR